MEDTKVVKKTPSVSLDLLMSYGSYSALAELMESFILCCVRVHDLDG